MKRVGIFLLSVVAVGGVLAAIVFLEPRSKERRFVAISTPPPEPFAGLPGTAVELVGTAMRSDGCAVSVREEEADRTRDYVITDGAFQGELIVPQLATEELVWLDVTCEQEVRERLARELVVADRGQGRDRVEVAAVHLENDVLEDGISRFLPPLINPQIEKWLDDLVQGYGEPALYPGARIEVRSARVRLKGTSLFLILEADVDLHFKDYMGVLHVQSEGLVFSCQVTLRPDEEIEVSNVAFNGSLCDAYRVDQPLVDRAIDAACAGLTRLFEDQLKEKLATILSAQATLWYQSLDTERLVGDSIAEWAERMHINRRLAKRLEDAQFRASELEGDSFSFVVTVSRDWLGRDPAAPMRVEDTEHPIDVGISVAFVNRILGVAFDRPLHRVLVDLAALGEDLGFAAEVARAQRRIRELEDPSGVAEKDSMVAWLDEFSLRFDTDGKLVPKLRVADDDVLSLYVSQARFLRSIEPSADIGLSAEARIEVRNVGDLHLFQLDRSHFFDHFTLEPLAVGDEPLSAEARLSRAALARFIRTAVTGDNEQLGDASRERWELFREALTAVPQLPGELEIGAMTVHVAEIRALYEKQALALSGNLQAVP